ncbi:MAG: extracellular solute-binding protein [Limnochordia bacterium]
MTGLRGRGKIIGGLWLLMLLVLPGMMVATATEVKLSFVHWFGAREPYRTQLAELIAHFEAQHPSIQVEQVNGDTDKIKTLIAGGAAPDVMALRSQAWGPLVTDVSLDITDLMKRDRIDPSAYRPGSMQAVHINGRYYGLPWTPGYNMMYVNRTLLYNVGAEAPGRGWTLDILKSLAQKTTRDLNGDGTIDQWGFRGGHYSKPSYYWPYLNGGRIMDEATGELTVMDNRVIDALQWWTDLKNEHDAMDTGGGSTDRFLNGKAAFMDLWEAPRTLFLDQKMHETYSWAIIDLPTGAGPTINFSLTHPLAIARDSKHHAEAWEFLRFFGTEGQQVLGDNGFFPLTRASIRRMVQKTPLPPGHSEQDIFGPLINPAGVPISHPFFLPGFAEVWAEVEKAWTRTVTQNLSVRVALEAALPAMQAAIASGGN